MCAGKHLRKAFHPARSANSFHCIPLIGFTHWLRAPTLQLTFAPHCGSFLQNVSRLLLLPFILSPCCHAAYLSPRQKSQPTSLVLAVGCIRSLILKPITPNQPQHRTAAAVKNCRLSPPPKSDLGCQLLNLSTHQPINISTFQTTLNLKTPYAKVSFASGKMQG